MRPAMELMPILWFSIGRYVSFLASEYTAACTGCVGERVFCLGNVRGARPSPPRRDAAVIVAARYPALFVTWTPQFGPILGAPQNGSCDPVWVCSIVLGGVCH